uniref:Telomere repeat-binding protein 3 n=1 Tax=Anthurium amnicola TaxID=1678845 RepID=A0A1D1YLU9_9ARAE
MVLQRRLDYGFNGYQAPIMPRRPRSARGNRSAGKKVVDNRMCAFDLLATVAGKLLLEENSLAPSNTTAGVSKPSFLDDNVKEEQQDEVKSFKFGLFDQGSSDEGIQVSEIGSRRQSRVFTLKECSQVSSTAGLSPRPIALKPDPSEEVASAEESVFNRHKDELGSIPGTTRGKFMSERRSPVFEGSHRANVEDGIPSPFQFGGQKAKIGLNGHVADLCCLEESMNVDLKPHLLSSDSSVEVPLHEDHTPQGSSSPKCRNGMVHFPVSRDDDEKSSGCTQPCYIPSKSIRSQRIGDRRIRKLLASKFWKVSPTLLKDEEFSNTDEEVKPVFRSRKMCYTRQRSQRCSFKRRKLFERGLMSTSDGTITSEGNAASSSVTGQKTSFESKDYNVKLSIKSFKVPELFIEIPEKATVGSLKRTVVEAVTAILCGGFRVGALLQGKKLRDDNKTLLQAGISHGDKLDSLAFTLEPKPSSQAPKKLTTNTEDTHFRPVCDGPEPLKGLPAIPASDAVMVDACTDPQPLATAGNCVESDHDSAPSPPDTASAEKNIPESKALVAVPTMMDVDALAVVPFHRKSRRAETAPRRIRRPFSVLEVEALVQAVEKLGTGRWRDVKLRAFENAKHRTYVDLKDKWKTLVHTAKIAPQQRRGEPVPQELLDRVLSANGYWSQHQAKLQVKQQQQPEPLLLA